MQHEEYATQFLTFTLGEELFALSINSVKEVLEHTKITKVPRTPPFMIGVINLRGHAVPIVDMRLKFGLEKGEITVNTCIIIVEVGEGEDVIQLGALVDSVREVIEMKSEDIEAPPKMGTSVDADFIRGMGKQDEEFVLILDVARIFSSEELSLAGCAAEGASAVGEDVQEIEIPANPAAAGAEGASLTL
jgi:purine-binding chemotaxis protein CheW